VRINTSIGRAASQQVKRHSRTPTQQHVEEGTCMSFRGPSLFDGPKNLTREGFFSTTCCVGLAFAKCIPKLYLGSAMTRHEGQSQHYILFHKPFGVLSQFTSEGGRRSLSEFGPFPGNVYAAGRLDVESEGLLLLTNDNALKHRLTEPRYRHSRTYLVQVERIPGKDSLDRLQHGIVIEGRRTQPAEIRLQDSEPVLPPRPVPIRFRKNVPTAWLEITLREGRNRQVRKMTAAVGHPTLRLIRTKIGNLGIEGLKPGEWRGLTEQEIGRLKKDLGIR